MAGKFVMKPMILVSLFTWISVLFAVLFVHDKISFWILAAVLLMWKVKPPSNDVAP